MKKYITKIEEFFSRDYRSLKLANYFYIFLFAISIIYGLLIFSYARKMNREYVPSTPPPTEFEKEIRDLTKDSPLGKMTPFIAKKDKKVATFLVAIGKKESNWGKFSPKKNGKDCFNYWGYRGPENPTASGYSCFHSRRQAVDVVGGRIEDLINQDIDTPKELAVWKCGRSCTWDNPQNVQKWIQDVDYYYKKIYE